MMWGYYEVVPHGLFGHKRIWHHNPNINVARSSQLRHNKKYVEGFEEVKVLPPAIKIKAD